MAGRSDEVARRLWWYRGLVAVSVFLATALAAYAKGPDWMWMYFLEPPDLGLLDLAFLAFLLYYVPFVAGHAMVVSLERRWAHRGLWLGLGIPAVCNVFILARLFDRYFHVGTRAEYLAGAATALTGDHPLKPVLNAGGIALGLTAAVLVALFVIEARRRAARPSP